MYSLNTFEVLKQTRPWPIRFSSYFLNIFDFFLFPSLEKSRTQYAFIIGLVLPQQPKRITILKPLSNQSLLFISRKEWWYLQLHTLLTLNGFPSDTDGENLWLLYYFKQTFLIIPEQPFFQQGTKEKFGIDEKWLTWCLENPFTCTMGRK